MLKEYILVIEVERTAPPSVFQRCAHATSPCSVCTVVKIEYTGSILQLPDYLTEQAGRGCVGTSLEDAGGCCAFYH